jgi:hypothetical protein
MDGLRKALVPLTAIALFLLLWEGLVWVNQWPNYKMASPSDLPPAFWKFRWMFLEMGWQTLWRTVLGLGLAVIFGTLIGMVMGFSRLIRDGLYPLLVGFNAIPKATLVPVISLIFIGQHDLFSDCRLGRHRTVNPGTGIPRHPALSGRGTDDDFLEDRPAQDPARILWRAEGVGDTGLYRHQSG